MTTTNFDAVIVGGGPAGASAAIHLTLGGARVALVERERFPRAKLCGEFISPECLTHFARLGASDLMLKAGGARVWATNFYAQGGRSISVPSEWFGAGGQEGWALGLSRAEMDERLLIRAREVGVEVLEQTQATGLLMTDRGRVEGVRTRVGRDERELRARVVVDATGRARALARHVERASEETGNAARQRPTLIAFKAHLQEVKADADACEIYFYQGGYGGLNRVEGALSNLCFIASAADVRACGSDAGRVLREVVQTNRRAAETLAGARVVGKWLAVSLESFGRAELVPAQGLLAVGDAASFIDPFTGSGMLMALESGELAANSIARTLPDLRSDPTHFNALAADYRAHYRERFGARLRLCSALRRAAFAPRFVTETVIRSLDVSAGLRRVLARATRGARQEAV